MQLPIDRDSPVPLYHQLAEALRWQISTGRLAEGSQLPPVREAAGELGVNMHTVRRAYSVLADDGLVRSDGGRGTYVLGRPEGGSGGDELVRFVDHVLREAAERFGVAAAELGPMVAARAGGGPPLVHVLECSESQCADHAAELAAAWAVDARPWSIERAGEPPAGPLVATYFHYAEILRRWPQRRGDLHFVPIHVDPDLPHRLARGARLEACEMDEDRARNLQADLGALFPPGTVPVAARVAPEPGDALAGAADDTLCCFAPRAWARLTAEQQGHPRARKVRYVVEREALGDLGSRLGWTRVAAAEAGLRAS